MKFKKASIFTTLVIAVMMLYAVISLVMVHRQTRQLQDRAATLQQQVAEKMTALLRQTVDMTPAGIIRRFDLRRPIYSATAAWGHFGVADRPWEQTDLAEKLKELAGI